MTTRLSDAKLDHEPHGAPKARRAKRDHFLNFRVNERAGRFYKSVRYKVTRQLKTQARRGLKTWMIGTKTEYVQINFYVLWCSLFKPLNVQFYSNSLIQMWSSITLWRTNVFTLFPKQFFFGLVESCETSESGPSSLPIIDIPKKPLAS